VRIILGEIQKKRKHSKETQWPWRKIERTNVKRETNISERDKLIFCSKNLCASIYALYSFQLFTGSLYIKFEVQVRRIL
jgi:hypothetical protein